MNVSSNRLVASFAYPCCALILSPLSGFDVGVRMAERCSKDFPKRMGTELQVRTSIILLASLCASYAHPSRQIVSWLCDPFWKEVFGKSIQKLRTNSRNLYEIEDSSFRMLYVCQLKRPLHSPQKYCNVCFSFHLQSPKLSVIICCPTRRTKM